MLGAIEGHWNWHHSIDHIRVPIRLHCNYGRILYRFRNKASQWCRTVQRRTRSAQCTLSTQNNEIVSIDMQISTEKYYLPFCEHYICIKQYKN